MEMTEISVRRTSVVSSRPFDEIVGRLMATIGRPELNAFHHAMTVARTVDDLEEVVQAAVGSSDLMEFARFDAGEWMTGRPADYDPIDLECNVLSTTR